MGRFNRRTFIGTSIGLSGAVAAVGLSGSDDRGQARRQARVMSVTDRVALGKTGLMVSVAGIGTGSSGWSHESNQTRLGQPMFTRLMRHALDNGINFFDLADNYGSNPYFRRAMEGVPRDRYVIQTKTHVRDPKKVSKDIDRFLNELGTDYIDSLIIHCVTEADWTTRYNAIMELFEEAGRKGKIRTQGVTCHSYAALEAAAASNWVKVNQVRWNPRGAHMDAEPEKVKSLFSKMRNKGQGMIGMKVVGQGDILKGSSALTAENCIRFQLESGVVDSFVVGVERLEHIDQLIRGTNLALREVGYKSTNQA
jgi:1-deoxyxylulose-5-phosphate synthase